MKKVLALMSMAAFLVVVGCGALGPVGGIFTSVKNPGGFTTGETTNPGGSAIAGESCAMSILGLIALGDWSVDAALKAAGAEGKTLKNVAVDHPMMSVLGVYGKFCTTVNAQVAQ
ncbi:TRL-like family protein [Myxococcota bacterium]|nr:TRL-like family protein [Myxococcota bacterium]